MAKSLESLECMKVIQWRDANKLIYPELGLLIHVPNEGRRSVQEGIKLGKMGLTKGVADFLLISRILALEMKTETGKQTKEQEEFERLIWRFGGEYHLVRSAIECVAKIKWCLGIPYQGMP